MQLNLKNPLIIFDLETTGMNIASDRIVEISYLKVSPNGKEECKTLRINPGMPIPPQSTEIHVVQTMLTKLTDSGIIREVIIPETDRTGYQPAFAILQMTLGMLMETIEKKIDEHGSLRDVEITNQLEEILDEYDTQFSKANVLIKDL